MVQCMLIAVAAALVNNVVLSQFLGLCPFLGVSKKTDTAAGMGAPKTRKEATAYVLYFRQRPGL